MTDVDDLLVWLRAQLDEDEQVARAVTAGPWTIKGRSVMAPARMVVAGCAGRELWPVDEDAEHIARHDPARVLREVEAKRRIIERCDHWVNQESYGMLLADEVLRLLALPYADRPGYRQEWALGAKVVEPDPHPYDPDCTCPVCLL